MRLEKQIEETRDEITYLEGSKDKIFHEFTARYSEILWTIRNLNRDLEAKLKILEGHGNDIEPV